MSDHLSSLKLKGLSIHLIEACTAPFSWKKKCKCQHFLSSVVELPQEQFSNIFSAALREICYTGVRWCGHSEPWLGKGWPDPMTKQEMVVKPALGDCEFIPILFGGNHSPSFPLISAPFSPPPVTFCLFAVRRQQQSPYWLEGNQDFIFFKYS